MKPFLDLDRRLVIAHRGGAKRCPENTMAAFNDAVSLGVDAIELDIHLSSDDVPVVIHDATLERTTNGRGAVADHTVAALSRLDAACHFDGSAPEVFRGQGWGVPTLESVLRRHTSMSFVVELKGGTTRLAERAIEVVRACDAVERVMFGGFRLEPLLAIRRSGLPFLTSAAVPEARSALIRALFGAGPRRPGYQLFQTPSMRRGVRIVSERFVRVSRQAGLPVQVWVVNEPEEIARLESWGVTGFISDRPDIAQAVLSGTTRPAP